MMILSDHLIKKSVIVRLKKLRFFSCDALLCIVQTSFFLPNRIKSRTTIFLKKLFNALEKLLSSTFSNQLRCTSFMETKCFLLERKSSRAWTVYPFSLRGRTIISMYLFSSFTEGLKIISMLPYPLTRIFHPSALHHGQNHIFHGDSVALSVFNP